MNIISAFLHSLLLDFLYKRERERETLKIAAKFFMFEKITKITLKVSNIVNRNR